MFPQTPHCELAVLFERVEAEIPEKVADESVGPEVVAETPADVVPDAADEDENHV